LARSRGHPPDRLCTLGDAATGPCAGPPPRLRVARGGSRTPGWLLRRLARLGLQGLRAGQDGGLGVAVEPHVVRHDNPVRRATRPTPRRGGPARGAPRPPPPGVPGGTASPRRSPLPLFWPARPPPPPPPAGGGKRGGWSRRAPGGGRRPPPRGGGAPPRPP